MKFTLPTLPYDYSALEPTISAETLEFHHGKHHNAYITKLNELVEGTALQGKSLEELIVSASGGVFNQAAQIWNHSFYFTGLTPNSEGEATGSLAQAINETFGSFAEFKNQFNASAIANFGAGWTWLVKNIDGSLELVNTSNADNPLTNKQTPVITVDVWEHAYYIDYRNARPKYLDEIWKIMNWNVAQQRFDQ
ncbi:superoxide dismutase [Marinomonas sp. PE14-40]|uniref:superoxide dismutase n=1 Tax=Marinomonas sp. PE14-40 TaxID=3060621 RepID=UPI003F680AA8